MEMFLQDSQTCWDTLYNVLEAANCVPPYSMLEDYMREYEEDGKLNEKQLFKACTLRPRYCRPPLKPSFDKTD